MTDYMTPMTDDEIMREELDYEFGAQFGDPRRCPNHPEVKTSSADGMFDGPCWKCEAAADGAFDEEEPMTTVTNDLTAPLAPGATGKAFVLAGKAIFTVSNPTGERYTFKVNAGKPRNGVVTYFGSFLTGPDNEADYTYLGVVNSESLRLIPTTKSPAHAADKHRPFRVLAWALSVLGSGKPLPAGYEIRHAGRCGRCGRTLTVPESIELGLGPECAGKAGL